MVKRHKSKSNRTPEHVVHSLQVLVIQEPNLTILTIKDSPHPLLQDPQPCHPHRTGWRNCWRCRGHLCCSRSPEEVRALSFGYRSCPSCSLSRSRSRKSNMSRSTYLEKWSTTDRRTRGWTTTLSSTTSVTTILQLGWRFLQSKLLNIHRKRDFMALHWQI